MVVAECLVADSTGVIVLVARNKQGGFTLYRLSPVAQLIYPLFQRAADTAQKGSIITLKGAKVEMFRGSMRLVVDGGQVEACGDLQEPVNVSGLRGALVVLQIASYMTLLLDAELSQYGLHVGTCKAVSCNLGQVFFYLCLWHAPKDLSL